MTTVGDGDLAPVTTLGRAVAVLTMFSGIGVFGAFTALIASLLVQPKKENEALDKIAARLNAIEKTLEIGLDEASGAEDDSKMSELNKRFN